MKMSFIAAARWEEREAAAWYRKENPGLALRFRSELKQTLTRVITNPNQFPLIGFRERRALLAVFPYAVLFETTDDEILVIAIAHTSREPSYWRTRIG